MSVIEGIKQLGRSLVSHCLFQEAAEPTELAPLEDQCRVCFLSGFLMEIEGVFYWTTAGHVIQVINDMLADPSIVVRGSRLIKGIGTGVVETDPILINIADHWQHYEYNPADGLDYGVIRLAESEKKRLEALDLSFVERHEWGGLLEHEFEVFGTLGFPTQNHRSWVTRVSEDGVHFEAKSSPSYVPLRRRQTSPFAETTFPQFIADIDPDRPESDDMDGHSGGPIFGLSRALGSVPIVAIQTAWCWEKRVVFGCPVHVFGPRLLEAIGRDPAPNRR